eukprot:CAMPEP_0198138960 /NCGR_PEP_ID=MMETSP1443-20131203/2312_1 /TAXON_ID=186043 /ORGANISM="Entomoneis sp., Strain CCMP2396" /LENGTH=81 /DNA_ID=CAMNT_0043800917 /DNA_START=93 /DNA_END=335 /DNA_ORIENTATION=+
MNIIAEPHEKQNSYYAEYDYEDHAEERPPTLAKIPQAEGSLYFPLKLSSKCSISSSKKGLPISFLGNHMDGASLFINPKQW